MHRLNKFGGGRKQRERVREREREREGNRKEERPGEENLI
jgi:hypothetical protein